MNSLIWTYLRRKRTIYVLKRDLSAHRKVDSWIFRKNMIMYIRDYTVCCFYSIFHLTSHGIRQPIGIQL